MVLGSFLVFAQIKIQDPSPKIKVKTGIVNKEIRLRWAVDEAIAWQKSNKIGFVVKRYTLKRNGSLLPVPEEKILGEVSAKPEKDWESIIEKNDNAAVIAQALYGESFEVEMGNQSKLQSIVDRSQEIEQRFAFSLMTADLDYEIALFAGWAFTDSTVLPNENYLYRVELNQKNNTKNLLIERGNALASLSDVTELPKPIDFIGIFKDKTVILSWEMLQLKDTYAAYFVEKSEDGNTFKALGDLPVVNISNRDENPAKGMIYVDSLQQNEKQFAYRLRGETIFGELGPYSNVVSGIGLSGAQAAPLIVKTAMSSKDDIELEWEFPLEEEKNISSFELIYSPDDRTSTYKLLKNKISSNNRKVQTKSQSPSNYFKILAVSKDGTRKESFSTLVQPEDNEPPIAPIEVRGKIDSTGIVHLEWKPNTEKDLQGYHVFRSDQKGDELARVTKRTFLEAKYSDTVQLASLNSKVYYYITAMDQRYNQSPPSVILELEKPDIVKPKSPIFESYEIKDGIISLKWLKSQSDDVAKYELYRKNLSSNESTFAKIYESKDIKTDILNYEDKNIKEDEKYKYYVIAIDKSNLKSDPSPEITLTNTDLKAKEAITNLTIQKNPSKKQIELLWKVKDPKSVVEIIVYREKQGEKPSMWATLQGAQNYIEDKDVSVGVSYTYYLKVILETSKPTKTEKVSITY